MALSDDIYDSLIAQQVNLLRMTTSVQRDVRTLFRDFSKKLADDIESIGPKTTPTKAAQRAKFAVMMAKTRKVTKAVTDVLSAEQLEQLTAVVGAESKGTITALNKALNVNMGLKILTDAQARAIAGNTLVDGAVMKDWWKSLDKGMRDKVSRELRHGLLLGQTNDTLRDRVMSVTDWGKKQAEKVVRTGAQAVANEARLKSLEANSDIIKGLEWVSTLDSRTTDICKALDGQAWYIESKNRMPGTTHKWRGPPPAHWQCRSSLTPIMKSWAEMAGVPEKRKFLDQIPMGMRASMDGEKPRNMNYEAWLRTKPEDFQKDVLGPTKWELWKQGKLSFTDLIDQSHDPLTVEELVALADAGKLGQIAPAKSTGGKTKRRSSQLFAEGELAQIAVEELMRLSEMEWKPFSRARFDMRKELRGQLRQAFGIGEEEEEE